MQKWCKVGSKRDRCGWTVSRPTEIGPSANDQPAAAVAGSGNSIVPLNFGSSRSTPKFSA